MKIGRIHIIMLIIILLLLGPMIAMQFSEAVKWSVFDFVLMSLLLIFIGIGIELILRKVKNPYKRAIFISIYTLIFLLIWGELAIGIFNSSIAGS